MEELLIRLKSRTKEENEELLLDLLESAKSAIFTRRFPYQEWPDEVEPRYRDLQYRIALAMYNKEGAEFERSHSENGVSRSWGSEGIPTELLAEIVPKAGVVL